MASGKTTVGRIVAARLGRLHVDSDEQVVARTGRTVREIFEEDGEPAFRREETAALEAAVADDRPTVVSVAGGAVLEPHNRDLLRRSGTVVWLRADPDLLAARVARSRTTHRPLLADDPVATLLRLDAERRPLYEELADVVVDVSDGPAEELADELLRKLGDRG
jgi:shikimate kinase